MSRSLGLWLKFKIQDNIYAMDCAYVKYISVVPSKELTKVANACDYVRGIYKFEGEVITLLSLRKIFGLDTLQSETEAFVDMIEERKNDYIDWAKTLENCIKNKETFTLSTDPDRCKFGMWYYNYVSDYSSVNFQLKKIDEPHRNLYALADEVNRLISFDDEKTKKKLDKIRKNITEDNMPEIIDILESTERVYRDVVKEMLVQINDKDVSVSFSVDAIVGIESLEIITASSRELKANVNEFSEFINGVARDKNDSIIMLLDIPKLLLFSNQSKV